MQIIETNYDGYRFRSRAEAMWAVFFNAIGWKYNYKMEGFGGSGFSYLPDFYMPQLEIWLEVKGAEPAEHEMNVARALSRSRRQRVLIAIGQPEPSDQMIIFEEGKASCLGRFHFAEDRRNEGEYWLASHEGAAISIGPVVGPDHERLPLLTQRVRAAYAAAKQTGFEHGEKPK